MLRHAGRTSLALVETYFQCINGDTVVLTKTAIMGSDRKVDDVTGQIRPITATARLSISCHRIKTAKQ